jgi:acyl-CoA thioester hydrolase
MSRFQTRIPLRWADLDIYRHVNHARTVTLLEEARVELVFRRAGEGGAGDWSDGLLVAGLEVDYKRQISYRGQSVLVSIWADQVRAASFLLRYELHTGPDDSDPVAVVASTKMVPFNLAAGHPRRLSQSERQFLGQWVEQDPEADTDTDNTRNEVRAG